MDPLLPLEVIEHIIDQCASSETSLQDMRNVSLTCHALSPRAHRLLFRAVKLLGTPDLHGFNELLDRKSHLRRAVQAISLHETHDETDSRALFSLVPAVLLSRLPNLKKWTIKSRSREREDPEEPLWVSFRPLSLAFMGACARNIHTLDLRAVSFSTCSDFVFYVSAFPRIQNLSCTRIQVKDAVLKNDALMARVAGRLRLQNLHIGEMVHRAPIGILLELISSTVHFSFDVGMLVDGPTSPTHLSRMPPITSLTVNIPPAHPDPLRAWTEIDRISRDLVLPSTLRRFLIETCPTHLREMLAGRARVPFEGIERPLLKTSIAALVVSVPVERATRSHDYNYDYDYSAALAPLFPALHNRGVLKVEFPPQSDSPLLVI